ncbi:Hint domain-containing protein [Pseudogemmobacter blasticus]|uniref:Hint domain-containing protein n=1 Tax=Fuscovulum blasticum TaxID=1075 RepID=UPI0015E6F4AF|nr:Hint domain-containing protein [Fuscovulum blasticum]
MTVFIGGPSNDVLIGGSGDDQFSGGGGNDLFNGAAGNDSLAGDGGADSLFGGIGNDIVDGGDEDDLIRGDDSTASAPAGNDTLYGGAGNDVIHGDNLTGPTPNFSAGTGNDLIYGGTGDDIVYAGAGGQDTLYGDEGNDILDFFALDNRANDLAYGGSGDDTIYSVLGAINQPFTGGVASIYGGEGNDYIGGRSADAPAQVSQLVFGGIGNDTIAMSETFLGIGALSYNDTLYGEDGDDVIRAGAGADRVYGGEGKDLLYGGADGDLIEGGLGEDTLNGDAGNDSLDGGGGADTLTGGTGDDRFIISGTAGDVITITDLGAGETAGANGTSLDNDFVDLSAWYNAGNLAAYNAQYGTSFTSALAAMQHDWANNGTLDWIAQQGGPTVHVTVTGTGVMDTEHTGVTCFARGTLIITDQGEVAVEDLRQGALVLTRDNGFQPLRWIGCTRIAAAEFARKPHLRPIRIRAGALGSGMPTADLFVSPQHRVLVSSAVTERMFGEREVLVAAKQLTGLAGIEVVNDGNGVEYWHFLLDEHQVVLSNGAPTESLYTGPEALASLSDEMRREILEIFPELADLDHGALAVPARQLVPGRRARHFAERIARNGLEPIS